MKLSYGLLVAAAMMLVIAPLALAKDGDGAPRAPKPPREGGGDGAPRAPKPPREGGKEGDGGPKTVTISGQLVRVEEGAIAVALKKSEKGAVENKGIAVDSATKVFIETDQMESVPGEGGKVKQRPKIVEGTLDDLKAKVGQRVTVGCIEDGGKALKILVFRAAPPKEGGREGGGKEGGGAPPAPKPPREGGKEGGR